MKAHELRIGNYVFKDGIFIAGLPDGVVQLTSNAIHKFSIGKLLFEPIPLTEEWLLKFGFKRIKSITGYEISIREYLNLEISTIGGKHYNCSIVPKDQDSGLWFNGSLRYVHQLQNLYFALTGEELTLTPKGIN